MLKPCEGVMRAANLSMPAANLYTVAVDSVEPF